MLGAENSDCTLIGDSTSDVMAGHLAGIAVIGYANKPGNAEALASVQAAATTDDLLGSASTKATWAKTATCAQPRSASRQAPTRALSRTGST